MAFWATLVSVVLRLGIYVYLGPYRAAMAAGDRVAAAAYPAAVLDALGLVVTAALAFVVAAGVWRLRRWPGEPRAHGAATLATCLMVVLGALNLIATLLDFATYRVQGAAAIVTWIFRILSVLGPTESLALFVVLDRAAAAGHRPFPRWLSYAWAIGLAVMLASIVNGAEAALPAWFSESWPWWSTVMSAAALLSLWHVGHLETSGLATDVAQVFGEPSAPADDRAWRGPAAGLAFTSTTIFVSIVAALATWVFDLANEVALGWSLAGPLALLAPGLNLLIDVAVLIGVVRYARLPGATGARGVATVTVGLLLLGVVLRCAALPAALDGVRDGVIGRYHRQDSRTFADLATVFGCAARVLLLASLQTVARWRGLPALARRATALLFAVGLTTVATTVFRSQLRALAPAHPLALTQLPTLILRAVVWALVALVLRRLARELRSDTSAAPSAAPVSS
jgi:hypothetical protein